MDDRVLVERAVRKTNSMLFSMGYVHDRLIPDWLAATTKARWPYIRVGMSKSKPGVETSPALAMLGCRCVAIDPDALEAWTLSTYGELEEGGPYAGDKENLLVFMLLHEIGHIRLGHSSGQFDDGFMSGLNIDKSTEKAREELADEFAASVIASSKLNVPRRYYSTYGSRVEVSLLNLMVRLNTGGERHPEIFTSKLQGDPRIYWDVGNTHPNIRLRVLTALAGIDLESYGGTAEEFERMRKAINQDLFKLVKRAEGEMIGSDPEPLE